jgi:hypothetical protein
MDGYTSGRAFQDWPTVTMPARVASVGGLFLFLIFNVAKGRAAPADGPKIPIEVLHERIPIWGNSHQRRHHRNLLFQMRIADIAA